MLTDDAFAEALQLEGLLEQVFGASDDVENRQQKQNRSCSCCFCKDLDRTSDQLSLFFGSFHCNYILPLLLDACSWRLL